MRHAIISVGLLLMLGCAGEEDMQTTQVGAEPTVEQMEAEAAALTGSPWTLVFSDEFSGVTVDQTKWRLADQAIVANGMVNSYNPAMISAAGGLLHISMQHVPWLGRAYSGGEIDTDKRSNYLYGLFQASLKAPCGSGLHASWWLWPDDNVWPPEIDTVEVRGNDPAHVKTTIHWANGIPGGSFLEHTTTLSPDACHAFHRYSIDWGPDHVTWYIDGVMVNRITDHIPTVAMRPELDLALDEYAGGVDATTILPATMLVDYVRIFRRVP